MSRKPIEDAYSSIIDRQERYRARLKASGKCLSCGKPKPCEYHTKKNAEYCKKWRQKLREQFEKYVRPNLQNGGEL